VRRLGLSVHTLSALEGIILIGLGLLWPRLALGTASSRVAFWFFVYSTLATLLPYVLAAVWGAGDSVIPLAAGGARGSRLQEAVIAGVLYTAAPTVLISLTLILWGLRGPAPWWPATSANACLPVDPIIARVRAKARRAGDQA
jgi:(hydroxyamino)benzene mutase